MDQSTWELCEIRMVKSGGLWRYTFMMEAVVSGPQGQYVAAAVRTASFRARRDVERDSSFIRLRADITDQLLADGWEPLPSVMDATGAMLPRFRRRAS